MKNDVPFIPNADDDLHCMQSAYRMILQYFKPAADISVEEWDKITGFEKDKGTWALASLLWFSRNGFEVKHVTSFDYEDFAATGGDYLIKLAGEEIGQWMIDHSNMPLEQKRAQELAASGIAECRVPTTQDIKQYLVKGYLARALVNARKLNGKSGYFGHAVVVIGYDEDGFAIHDPGLPPLKNRHVSYEDFEAAWADPNQDTKEIDLIRQQ